MRGLFPNMNLEQRYHLRALSAEQNRCEANQWELIRWYFCNTTVRKARMDFGMTSDRSNFDIVLICWIPTHGILCWDLMITTVAFSHSQTIGFLLLLLQINCSLIIMVPVAKHNSKRFTLCACSLRCVRDCKPLYYWCPRTFPIPRNPQRFVRKSGQNHVVESTAVSYHKKC